MISAEPFSDNSSQMGPCQITAMRLWPAADYEPYRGCVSVDKVRWWTTTASRSWWWRSQVTGVYSDYSIREMKLTHRTITRDGQINNWSRNIVNKRRSSRSPEIVNILVRVRDRMKTFTNCVFVRQMLTDEPKLQNMFLLHFVMVGLNRN